LEASRAGVIEAEAKAGAAASFAELGDVLSRLNERDRVLLDKTRAEEATSQYLNELNRFTYDPQGGYTSIRSGDVVKKDLRKEYAEKRLEAAKKIEEKLSTPEQRNAFKQRAGLANQQFDASLHRYVADQTNIYHEQVYDGVIKFDQSYAAANWQQPGVIESSIIRSFDAIDSEAVRKGIPEATVVMMKEATEAQIHSTIVETMLVEGKDQAALQYYQGIEKRLTPEARVTLGLKVRSASTDGDALRGADAIWTLAGPTGENDPVLIANMEKEARRQYKDDPRVLGSVIAQLRSMAGAYESQRQEVIAGRKATVLEAYHNNATLSDIQRMPEYLEMDGSSKQQLRDYMVNSGWTADQRARAQQSYVEGDKATQGFQRYWELSNPNELQRMSEAQILSLTPEMGQQLVGDLMAQKRRIMAAGAGGGASVLEVTVDQELFNTLAHDAGLKPFDKNLSSEQKAYLGRLKNKVEKTIDLHQQQLGRKLQRSEKEELMQKEIDSQVLVDEYGRDPKRPAGAIGAEQRSKVYVPLADIDNGWKSEAINVMRSKGFVNFRLDDKDIQRRYKDRLQKAYGLRITGGSQEEIDRALRGE
jgi:hypothetical protein